VEDLPPHVLNYEHAKRTGKALRSLAEIEKTHINEVLLHTESLEEAAQILGIDPTTLWRKRKKYQMD
jgi:two-component system, NtrC family, response regulator AlgB